MSKSAYPDLIRSLSSFSDESFTENQAAVYIAILKMGEETGSAIAKESGINRSKIYDTLAQLEEKGAVKKISREGKSRYVAVDPELVLNKILLKFKTSIETSIHQLEPIKNLGEEIEETKITLTKLFLDDLDANDFLYIIGSKERAISTFTEYLSKDNRPGRQVKILNLNDRSNDRGSIILVNGDRAYLFGTPVGKSFDALQIESKELANFILGLIESRWSNDAPADILERIENGQINALYLGKSLDMVYTINGSVQQEYDRPVTFLISDESISFIYQGLMDDPKIMFRFAESIRIDADNSLFLKVVFKNSSVGELRLRTVENPIYLKNLIETLIKINPN